MSALVQQIQDGFKSTEIGVIPEEWNTKQLKSVFNLKNGFAFKGEYFSDKGPIVLTPGNFKLSGGLYFEQRNTKRYEGIYPKGFEFENGDLVVVMTDLTPDCNLLGKPAFIENEEKVLHNQRIGKISIQSESWDSKFLYYTLLSPVYLSVIKNAATGSTVRHTSPTTILNSWVVEPPKKEQTAIANALSDVDVLLTELEKLIAKKQAIKTATMQQLLTGKTRLPQFATYTEGEKQGVPEGKSKGTKPSELGEIPEDWDVQELKQLTTTHNAGIYKNKSEYGSGINIAGVGDIYNISKIDGQIFRRVPLNESEKKQYLLQEGDLVYGESSLVREGIARTVYVDRQGEGTAFAWHTRRYKVNTDKVNPIYLYYYLAGSAGRSHMISNSITTALTGINTEAYFSCPIKLPNIQEQTAIATILSDMDNEIQTLEQRLAKTRQIKQGMMQELLTGRTRLPFEKE